MTTADHSFATAILAIYIFLSLPTLYVSARHGLKALALIDWGYLFVFCILKIIGSVMQLNDSPGSGAAIIGNIGLSPLLLAIAGILHEAYVPHTRGQASPLP